MAKQDQANPWRHFHLGLELAGAIVVLGLIGYWVDYQFGTDPWGVLVGVLLGATGGMYLFIKDALAANRQFSYSQFARRDLSGDHDRADEPASPESESDEPGKPDAADESDAPRDDKPSRPDEPHER